MRKRLKIYLILLTFMILSLILKENNYYTCYFVIAFAMFT